MTTDTEYPSVESLPDPDELAALRDSIRGVLADVCSRKRVHDHIDGKISLDAALWQTAAELGWLGIHLPESLGGLDVGAAGFALLFRELGECVAPGPFLPSLSAARAIVRSGAGPDALCHVEEIVQGGKGISIPFNLTGTGPSCRFLGDPGSGLAVRQGPEGKDDWALVSLGSTSSLDMWDLTRQVFETDLADEKVLSALPRGFGQHLAESVALALAAESTGLGHALLSQTVEFTSQRVQFGQPIGSFQALKHRMAELASNVEVARLATEHAIERIANSYPDALFWALQAKVTASEAAVATASESTLLHGGVGFTWEYDPHLFLKRSQLNTMLMAPNHLLLDHAWHLWLEADDEGRDVTELPTI